MGKLLVLGAIFSFWLASKLAVVLSPFNPIHELECWSLQFADSWLVSFGIYSLRPRFLECVEKLKDEFPQGSSWETKVGVVYLSPENMSTYFASNDPKILDVPFIIRGFLNQPGTTFDLSKYADLDYFESHVNMSNVYNFDSKGKAESLQFGEALNRLKNGDGLYMKFNRDFTNFEPEFRKAVDDATEVLFKMGGPKVQHALRDAIKVTFLTFGTKMRTKIHNAMSANWFYQVVGMKDWKLYEPHQSIYLQPFNFPNAIASGSHFDTNFTGGPKYLSFRTYPGDFLFFPSFWLHEVDNVGEGMKLAIGLRPSISGTIEMWKTALIPFYEWPTSTTGLALCHLGPSVSIIANNILIRLKTKIATVFYGMNEEEAKKGFEEADRNRGRDWWVKSAYKNKELVKATGLEANLNSDDNF